MTNLEFYKDEIYKGVIFCKLAHILNYGKHCGTKSCECCGFHNIDKKGVDKCIDLLFAEHKEPIKLKQWEKDVLSFYSGEQGFNETVFAKKLKDRGYFNGVTDTSMTVREILDNCEVIEK